MKVTMIKCDNPDCYAVGAPEFQKPLRTPYGWLTLKGSYFGSGPSIDVTVCRLDCLEAAVYEQTKQDD